MLITAGEVQQFLIGGKYRKTFLKQEARLFYFALYFPGNKTAVTDFRIIPVKMWLFCLPAFPGKKGKVGKRRQQPGNNIP